MDRAMVLEAVALTKQTPMLCAMRRARGDSEVQRFYKNSVLFLTGGSGFLGKQLLEKLFRSCQISKVYLLLRPKKGKNVIERKQDILKDPVFDTLRKEQPKFSDKILAIEGDVAKMRIGITDQDWETITDEVDVIFHMAATTRFDEPLPTATLTNVRGTREVINLGKACKKLSAFVYVSTAYTHATKTVIGENIQEKFYDSPIPPEAIISMAEEVKVQILRNITTDLIESWPNTYTFTKAIAEELVRTSSDGLPTCIVRPAIVTNTYLEPSPGWLDRSCVFGVVGLIYGIAMGVLHVGLARKHIKTAFVPCDYVNNAIIVAAKETATRKANAGNETKIYNISSTQKNPVTISKMLIDVYEREGRKYISPKCVYYSFFFITPSMLWFNILSLFLHIIPAYLIDFVLLLLGKQNGFGRMAKKLYNLCAIISYFSMNEWNFLDDNLDELYSNLSEEDKAIFNFDISNMDWNEYLILINIGLRKFIIKDGLKDTEYGAMKQKIFKIVHYILLILYIYCIWQIIYYVYYITSNFILALLM